MFRRILKRRFVFCLVYLCIIGGAVAAYASRTRPISGASLTLPSSAKAPNPSRPSSTQSPAPPSIVSFQPTSGIPGNRIVITGMNFGRTGGENQVFFGDASAQVIAANSGLIVVSVPEAVDSPIRVQTSGGSVTTSQPFTYLPSITVTPRGVSVTVTQTFQFQALPRNFTSQPSIEWLVDGVVGGNPTVGTISTEGLYTPPPALNDCVRVHTVTARVPGQSAIFGTAQVRISVPFMS